MRFTLCKFFLSVTMTALASAGMTLHTRLWAEAIVSFSILLYIAVAILAFRGGGQARAFRIAFAAIGGGYLLLVLCNTFTPIRDLLVTNRTLVLAGSALHVSTIKPSGFATPSTYTGTSTITPSTVGRASVDLRRLRFRRIQFETLRLVVCHFRKPRRVSKACQVALISILQIAGRPRGEHEAR